MPLAHFSKRYGVNDAAVYKLTTDPSGAAPTYATKVDVPGVKSLDMGLDVKTQTLRGDNALLAADSVLEQVKGKLTYAKFSFDVWAAMLSSTVADSGTTPNQKSTMTVAQTDAPAYHKIEAQTKQVDYVTGDIHAIAYKAMPGTIAGGFNEEDYQEESYEFIAVPLIGTITGGPANAWFTLIANETAAAIT